MPQPESDSPKTSRWPVLAESPSLRLVTLCGLYVAQGLPWGFVGVAVAAVLAARGFDPTAIAELTVMATLTWWL